jgi:hypothetical protein
MRISITRRKQHRDRTASIARGKASACLRAVGDNQHPLNLLLPIRLRPQETEGWCWAASMEMILDYLGAGSSQRELATKQFSSNNCVPDPGSPCRGGAWPEFERLGFTCKTTPVALSWEAVIHEISAGRPFAFCRKWDDGHYHIMVVSGCYLTPTGRRYLQIHNPSPQSVGSINKVPYCQYLRGKGFAHERTYYEIKKRQP